MAHSATETAAIPSELYDENFGRDSYAPFRITWPQLRSLAAVPRLDDTYLKDLNRALRGYGARVEVMAPDSLREEFAEMVRTLTKRYFD